MPKIIDLAKDSDALAIEITDAAPEAVALLGDARNLEFYIIGKAGDFDEFAVPVISLLKTSGAACLWPKPRRSRVFGGGADVHITGSFIEPLPRKGDLNLLLAQSVAAVPEELHAMLTFVVRKRTPARIDIVSCAASAGIEDGLRKSIAEHSKRWKDVPVHFHCLETLPVGGDDIDFENMFFDHIDNRPRKIADVMPEWVFEKIKGSAA